MIGRVAGRQPLDRSSIRRRRATCGTPTPTRRWRAPTWASRRRSALEEGLAAEYRVADWNTVITNDSHFASRRWLLLASRSLAAAAACACAHAAARVPPGTDRAGQVPVRQGHRGARTTRSGSPRASSSSRSPKPTPQSPFRPDAKLGIGDTYLGEGTAEALVLAINEFREFLSFYPTNARADYAQYKLGMAHFRQMRAPQRDQTETRDAIKEFEAFVDALSEQQLMPEVKAKLREARDRLSEADYLVGYFYFRQRWYPGAIDRFKALLKDDPEYTGRDAVYLPSRRVARRGPSRKPRRFPTSSKLVQEFEQSEYLPRAQKRIAELKTQAAVKPIRRLTHAIVRVHPGRGVVARRVRTAAPRRAPTPMSPLEIARGVCAAADPRRARRRRCCGSSARRTRSRAPCSAPATCWSSTAAPAPACSSASSSSSAARIASASPAAQRRCASGARTGGWITHRRRQRVDRDCRVRSRLRRDRRRAITSSRSSRRSCRPAPTATRRRASPTSTRSGQRRHRQRRPQHDRRPATSC